MQKLPVALSIDQGGGSGERPGSAALQKSLAHGEIGHRCAQRRGVNCLLQLDAKLERATMTLRKFCVTASSEDRLCIRRWTIGVSAFYGILAVTAFFVLHAPNDTIAARDMAATQHATIVR